MTRIIHLTIQTQKDDIFEIEIDSSETIENVKALVEVNTGIPLDKQVLVHNNKQLNNNDKLEEKGVNDHDMIFVGFNQNMPQQQQSQMANPQIQAQEFLRQVQADPHLLQQILNGNPVLGEAILSGDLNKIQQMLQKLEDQKRDHERNLQRRIAELNADPFNVEAQKAIEEEIRLGNVLENRDQAIEHMPESFGRVVMLYIDCIVGNTPMKAFVDSGAQQTIMSLDCAKRCGLDRFIDKQFAGIAKGVGTCRIVGRVHMAQIKIGNTFFPCSFSILEEQSMDFLLGLDMLRRHQCSIDLQSNVLRIGGEVTPFLSEKDLPNKFKDEDPEEASGPSLLTGNNQPTLSGTQDKPIQIPQIIVPNPNEIAAQNRNNAQSQPVPVPQSNSDPMEAGINQLMGLGFSRAQAAEALRAAGGNVDVAAGILFG